MELAKRLQSLTPSTTLAITAKANELKAKGIEVIGLGAGEPDFHTPKHIIDAAYEAMVAGRTKYTPSGGLVELKRAIQGKLQRDQNLSYELSEIIVTSGAKHALYTLFQVLLNEGDEVIIPIPYWVSYPEQVKLAGGKPIFIETTEKESFKLAPEKLLEKITPKTKAIIINSPNNPTGIVYRKEELMKIGKICIDHDILLISDEIYEKLIYGKDQHVSVASLGERYKNQTIIINGVSKSHSMTGWRIGYAAGNKKIIQQMTALASHSTSNPTTPAQYAAIAAYEGTEQSVEDMRSAFEKRLNLAVEKIEQIPGFSVVKPQGAFYLFPNVKEAATRCGFETVDDFAASLLDQGKVAVIPGSGFGLPDHIRLSYATSPQLIEEAIERIGQFVQKHWK
ncbi:pyridoxal phosphate-dependent aminotransferase [Fervidibacillus albus]|uniref:Aminotransferase n=1 Tax=Fervidibacillus albus TaxID=2980026 RepID=A0A9E8LXG7_9BACI|nr:pyridoxal phosphate-dependent aminotransferase [Fervidibacillus albus]WAA10584.1 pyridoxal phosphate-dependent aminotransferase [Fervidibacillus albus]